MVQKKQEGRFSSFSLPLDIFPQMKAPSLFFLFCGLSFANANTSLTLYNDNFAIIRQQVPLDLISGENVINFDSVTSQLEPNSVVLRPTSDTLKFSIKEQNYHNDTISESLLLDQFVGQTIPFILPKTDSIIPDKVLGKVIRSGYTKGYKNEEPIIQIEGDLRFGLPGTPLFPTLGTDSILTPTLSWIIESESKQSGAAELSYLSSGLSWSTDYNLIVDDAKPLAQLNGWVTLNNSSGTAFEQANVRLMAGDINRSSPNVPEEFAVATTTSYNKRLNDSPQVSQRSIDSYHIYHVNHPITLKDRQTKQIQFITSSQIKATQTYVYEAQKHARFYGSPQTSKGQSANFHTKVSIYWSFDNSSDSGLGVPLPKGKIRLYKGDEKSLEFMGDNLVSHTPQGETIRFHTGEAFDFIGDRRITSFEATKKQIKETVEIKLTNRSKEEAIIQVREALTRWDDWTISENSHPYEAEDSHHITFSISVPPNSEKTISYQVLYKLAQ